ncbi:MAG: hypothetical protein ACOYL6_13520 [Bacteriovoracaceae bacterium]
MEMTYWRKCGSCKKEIGFNTAYQVCSVSSCKQFAFCSVDCWNLHNPVMNHKSSWAEEEISPKKELATPEKVEAPRRFIVSSKPGATSIPSLPSSPMETEILIVASKLKQYVKDKYDMNTAASVMDALSNEVRRLTDKACENAKRDGRKTLMDRDF